MTDSEIQQQLDDERKNSNNLVAQNDALKTMCIDSNNIIFQLRTSINLLNQTNSDLSTRLEESLRQIEALNTRIVEMENNRVALQEDLVSR